MPFDPPPTSYSDKAGYRDNVDDIEALASRALSPISDFPPGDSYDATEDDHSITSSDDDDDDDDMSLSDEEGQRDVAALRQKTSDILKEFEDFAQDVNESSTTSREIMNTLTGNNNTINRGEETVKSRIAAGGGDAVLNRDWSRNDRNLHDVGFGSDDDSMGGYNKYDKRGFFKYAVPFFHSKKFKVIAAGVAVAFVLVLIVGSMTSTGGRGEVGDFGDVVMVEDLEDEARKPEDFIVSIDTSTCEDISTAIITTDGHTCEDFIAHVGRVPLHNARCSHESPVKNEKGETLLVKDVCRLSCGVCGDAWTDSGVPQAQTEAGQAQASQPQAPQPQAPQPQASATISIDTSTCEDNPTAIITTDGHTCEDFIAHVGRVPLHNARCSHESPVKNEKGETLLVKDVCRLSCGVCGNAWTGAQQQEPQAAETTPVESVSSPASTTTVDTTPVESVSSPSIQQTQGPQAAETTPVESASSPASTTTVETTPVESVSSPPIQQSQGSSSTATTPSVFTREEGWEGFSSSAAIDFCGGKGLSLCSYEAVCPLGEGNPPFVMATHFTWVPISDGSDWVAIGEQRSCEQWSKTHEESPPWADAGEAIEEITRSVYCCESDNPARNTEIPTEDTNSNTIEDSGSIQSIPASTSGLSEQQAYNYVGKTYAPVWFDRSSGWEGTTYEAAVQFCLSLEQNVNLCPYEAYCPMGPRTTTPFGGLRDDDGSWAPAINGREWWVQVGGTDNICKKADLDPNWGQDGSNEELTRHILCCKYVN